MGAADLASELARPLQTRNGPPSRFGARFYLSTTQDATYYTARGASGNVENILGLLSDSAQSLHVDGSMKRLWDELVSSQPTRTDALPTAQLSRTFHEHTFPGSPLGRTAMATDYDKLGTGDLQTWIDRTVRPKGAVLAVVGDIDMVETEKLVRDWFEGWSRRAGPARRGPAAAAGDRRAPRPGRSGGPTRRFNKRKFASAARCRTQLRTDALPYACSVHTSEVGSATWRAVTLAQATASMEAVTPTDRQPTWTFRETLTPAPLTRVLAVARNELENLGTAKVSGDDLDLLKWRQGIAYNLRYTTNSRPGASAWWRMRLADLPVDSIEKYPELFAR